MSFLIFNGVHYCGRDHVVLGDDLMEEKDLWPRVMDTKSKNYCPRDHLYLFSKSRVSIIFTSYFILFNLIKMTKQNYAHVLLLSKFVLRFF
jgi:hypothetical protein